MTESAVDHWKSLKVFIMKYSDGGNAKRGILNTRYSSFSVSNDQTEWGPRQLYCSLRSQSVKDGADTAERPLSYILQCVSSGDEIYCVLMVLHDLCRHVC